MAFRFRRSADELPVGRKNIAHVPFLIGADGAYLSEINLFLRERALGTWCANDRASAYRVAEPLSENSIDAYSRDLENWVGYMEASGTDWRGLAYQDLLDGYDRAQVTGAWSQRGEPLAAATINRRVDRATEFLMWAAYRDLRRPFILGRRPKRDRSGRRELTDATTRVARHRQNPKRLRLPEEHEVDAWLADVRARSGATLALCCGVILSTGMRREEVALLRAWQVPELESVRPGAPARMPICFGTKGNRQVGDQDRKGKPRTLRFEASTLQQLLNYRDLRRPLGMSARRRRGLALTERLFVVPETGHEISPDMIYRAWVNSDRLPYRGFSPHLGRHYFACATLLHLLRLEREIALGAEAAGIAVALTHADRIIDLYLKPVLGHVSATTTELYLDWLADKLWVGPAQTSWAQHLDG